MEFYRSQAKFIVRLNSNRWNRNVEFFFHELGKYDVFIGCETSNFEIIMGSHIFDVLALVWNLIAHLFYLKPAKFQIPF